MKFSNESLNQLITCDQRLQDLFEAVLSYGVDCTVICGYRGEAAQEEAFRTGKSKLHWGQSKHNSLPSKAVDVAPYFPGGIPWDDKTRFVAFANFVLGVAAARGIPLRWGGDWNGDRTFNESFVDMPHFEIAEGTPG